MIHATLAHVARVLRLVAGAACACNAGQIATQPSNTPEVEAVRGPEVTVPPEAPVPAPAAEPEPVEKPSLEGASVSGFRLAALPVPDFLDSVVSVPNGDRRLPVVIATHGAGGDPEWTCNEWGARVRGSALVLCPRGKPISLREPSGFYYPEHLTLEKEVLAAIAALESTLPARVSPGPMLYTGYSQGATMGALFVVAHASRFPSLVLTEGGFGSWNRSVANRFQAGGGQRVLFVCGGKGCRDRAEQSARVLEQAGVKARVEYVPGGGHTDGGSVGQRLDETYGWAIGD